MFYFPFRYNYALAVFSVVYIGAALLFTYIFGAVGFILANCSNMGLRISYRYGLPLIYSDEFYAVHCIIIFGLETKIHNIL